MTRLLVVSAGLSVPSSTRLLADRLASASVTALASYDVPAEVDVVELRNLAHDLTDFGSTGDGALSERVDRAGRELAALVAR